MLSRFTLAIGLCLGGAAVGFAQEESPIPPIGIGTILHPLEVDGAEAGELSQATSAPQRDRVHIFVVNGMDPLYIGNLNGMAGHLQALGFRHTGFYRILQTGRLRHDIRACRESCPDACIVLVGYSLGANIVRTVAHDLNRSGISIDALVYLGGDSIGNTRYSRPDNVGKIINITGHGFVLYGYDLVMNGENIDGADNLRVDAPHLSVPSRHETLTFLSHEVVTLSQQPPAAMPQLRTGQTSPTPAFQTKPADPSPASTQGHVRADLMMPIALD